MGGVNMIWAAALLLALIPSAGRCKDSLRDPEALYLDRLQPPRRVELTAVRSCPVYASRTFNGYIANLPAGAKVLLVAYSPESFLIRDDSGKTSGWVAASNLSPPGAQIVEALQAAQAEEAAYEKAIQEKEVAAGMTFDHVLRALGKPDSKSFRADENTRFDLWSYIQYEYRSELRPYADPLTGRIFYQTVRVKIPSGRLNVEFKNGRVSAVEKTHAAPGALSPGVYGP